MVEVGSSQRNEQNDTMSLKAWVQKWCTVASICISLAKASHRTKFSISGAEKLIPPMKAGERE